MHTQFEMTCGIVPSPSNPSNILYCGDMYCTGVCTVCVTAGTYRAISTGGRPLSFPGRCVLVSWTQPCTYILASFPDYNGNEARTLVMMHTLHHTVSLPLYCSKNFQQCKEVLGTIDTDGAVK